MYAIIYLCVLCSGYLIYCRIHFSHAWMSRVLVAVLFGLLAAGMVPRPEFFVDTKRFFESINQLRVSFWDATSLNDKIDSLNAIGYSDVPIAGVLLIIGAFFRTNQVFMFLVGFWIAFGLLMIIDQFASVSDVSPAQNKMLAYLGVFTWFNFQAAVQGVRNMIAFATITACAYYLLNKPTKPSLKYIVVAITAFSMIWMHPSSILPLLIIVLCVFISNKIILRILDFALLTYGYVQTSILPFILQVPFIANSTSLSFKTTQYLTNSGDSALSSSIGLYRDLLKDGLLVLIICATLLLIKRYGQSVVSLRISRKYFEFFVAINCLTFGSFSNGVLFDRLSSLLLMVGLPVVVLGVSRVNKLIVQSKNTRAIIVFSLFFLIICLISVAFLIDNLRAGVKYYSIFF